MFVVVFHFASSAHSYFRTLGHFLEWPGGDDLKGDTRSWTTSIGEKNSLLYRRIKESYHCIINISFGRPFK